MSINQHYDAVLSDLERRRGHCAEELRMLDVTIHSIRQFLLNGASGAQQGTMALPPLQSKPLLAAPGRYEGMSVRWGVLMLLGEDSSVPIQTSEIAVALKKGGITTGGKNFNANVSAVLSGMCNHRKEIESVKGGYQITDHGRDVWKAIKNTPQVHARLNASAS